MINLLLQGCVLCFERLQGGSGRRDVVVLLDNSIYGKPRECCGERRDDERAEHSPFFSATGVKPATYEWCGLRRLSSHGVLEGR